MSTPVTFWLKRRTIEDDPGGTFHVSNPLENAITRGISLWYSQKVQRRKNQLRPPLVCVHKHETTEAAVSRLAFPSKTPDSARQRNRHNCRRATRLRMSTATAKQRVAKLHNPLLYRMWMASDPTAVTASGEFSTRERTKQQPMNRDQNSRFCVAEIVSQKKRGRLDKV